MKAAYFPFTIIEDRSLKLLRSFFTTIHIYLPSRVEADGLIAEAAGGDDRLKLHLPDEATQQQVEKTYQSCVGWREATLGATPSFFKGGRVPFFDDNSIAFLRREIEKQQTEGDFRPDPLLPARVFLRLAADHDRRQAEIETSLARLERKKKNFFTSLRGEETGQAEEDLFTPERYDRGTEMTAARTAAWANLALATGLEADILVTDSRAVLDYLEETVPGGERSLEETKLWVPSPGPAAASDPHWQRFLDELRDKLLNDHGEGTITPPRPPAFSQQDKNIKAALDILAFPGTGPAGLLTSLTDTASSRFSSQNRSSPTKTVSICLRPL